MWDHCADRYNCRTTALIMHGSDRYNCRTSLRIDFVEEPEQCYFVVFIFTMNGTNDHGRNGHGWNDGTIMDDHGFESFEERTERSWTTTDSRVSRNGRNDHGRPHSQNDLFSVFSR